jgi:type IV secretion system T-DNA border endonuclease VirD2
VADELQGFYDRAAAAIDHAVAHDAVPENDRLVRTLRSMGRIMQTEGKVEFRGDAHAERFADELRQRYGKGVVADLAAGKTDALARDIESDEDRRWIARAVVSAAKSHVAFGLTLSAARESERGLREARNPKNRDWER